MASTEQKDTRQRRPIWLPVDLAKQLDQLCKRLHLNRVEFVRKAIDDQAKANRRR